jgi:hypothetical protein
MDYSTGRYSVVNSGGVQIGLIDGDEFVRCGTDLLYRIDGDEVYGVVSAYPLLAFIENGIAITPQGEVLFRIEDEFA